jgi:hypothetical protein
MAADSEAGIKEKDFIVINGEKFRKDEVNISQLVIEELKEKPFLNYRYFVHKYGISKQRVDTIVYLARKKGIELRPNRKPWTRKQQGNHENLTNKGRDGSAKKP